MAARIDIACRIGPTTNSFKVAYPTGAGYTTLTLPDALHMTASALAAALHAAVQSVNANLSCTLSGAVFTFSTTGSNFDIQFHQPALRTWLGFTSTTYTNQSSRGATSPRIFIGTYPWQNDSFTWVRNKKTSTRSFNQASSIALSKWKEWSTTALLTSTELSAFRSVASYMLKGVPFSWYRDSTVSTAWSFTNWSGRLECVLRPGSDAYSDDWQTAPHQTLVNVPLEFVEFLP